MGNLLGSGGGGAASAGYGTVLAPGQGSSGWSPGGWQPSGSWDFSTPQGPNPGPWAGGYDSGNTGNWLSPGMAQGLASGLGEFTKGIANQRNESPQALRANNQQYQYKSNGVVGEAPKLPSGNPARIDPTVSGGYTPIERPLPPVAPAGYRAPIEPTRGGGVFRAKRYVIT